MRALVQLVRALELDGELGGKGHPTGGAGAVIDDDDCIGETRA